MKHLQTLFDRALDAVVAMDAAGDVIAWNGAAEDMFGWPREKAMGASMGELIVPPKHRESHAKGLEHYNRTGEGPVLEQRVKITAMHRDGTEFPVELSIFALPMEGGEQSFYAFIRSLAVEQAARLEQEMRAREGEALLAVAQKLLEDVSFDEFTQFCLETVCEISGMEAAHFHVVRGRGSNARLDPTGIWHLANESFQPVVQATSLLHFALGEGLPGRAWQTGELESLDIMAEPDQFVRKDVFEAVGLTRAVALPVWKDGNVQGVLEFFGPSSARQDKDVMRLLQTIGSQIGVAISRKESAEHRETLRREMSHRVGNSLTVLSSIYRSCSKAANSKDELDDTFLQRLQAVGRANRIAVEDAAHGVAMPALIKDAVGILPEGGDISIQAPNVMVDSDSVMPLALILNELATNALKHGASEEGYSRDINISFDETDEKLSLRWSEIRAIPLSAPPPKPGRVGFGTKLMQIMAEGRLGGSIERCHDETGFHVVLHLPRARFQASPDVV